MLCASAESQRKLKTNRKKSKKRRKDADIENYRLGYETEKVRSKSIPCLIVFSPSVFLFYDARLERNPEKEVFERNQFRKEVERRMTKTTRQHRRIVGGVRRC